MTAREHLRHRTAIVDTWIVRHSIDLLRVSIGLVFLFFGALKLFPGVSPAEALAKETMGLLTFGIVPGGVGLAGVALLEITIGLTFVTGRLLGLGVAALAVALVGILSPLLLLGGELFTGPHGAPNLQGQYVLKDVVLAAGGLVVATTVRGAHLTRRRRGRGPRRSGRPAQA